MKIFIVGMKSIIEALEPFVFFPKYSSEIDKILKKSDEDALRSDWEAIDGDFGKILPWLRSETSAGTIE